MQQETITLSTGEVVAVDRWKLRVQAAYIQLDGGGMTAAKEWTTEAHTNRKVWLPATVRTGSFEISPRQAIRLAEILTHAARLAAELDEQYKPGSEVAG